MRSVRAFVAVPMLLLAVGLVRAADVDPNLPNDSELVLSVNLEQLLNSPLGKKYLRVALENALKSNGQIQDVLKYLELDPYRDVNRVTVALSSTASDTGFVIVNGKFNLKKIAELAERVAADRTRKFKIHKEGNVTIYEGAANDDKPIFAAFANDTTLLLSSDKEMLRGSAKTGKPKRELAVLIQNADARQTAWLAALPAVAGALPVEDPAQRKAVEKLEGVVGALRVEASARLDLHLINQTPQAALAMNRIFIDLVGGVKLIAPNAIKEKPELAPVFEAISAMRTLVRGKTVTITTELATDQIEKLVKLILPGK
jgi:hypothetical protein